MNLHLITTCKCNFFSSKGTRKSDWVNKLLLSVYCMIELDGQQEMNSMASLKSPSLIMSCKGPLFLILSQFLFQFY